MWILITIPVIAQEQIHIIQKGETIYSIARSYGVDPDDILKLNSIGDPRKVQTGQRIRIPRLNSGSQSGSSAVRYLEYRAENGDSLYGIARRYNTTVQVLRSMNKMSEDYVLKIGDTLRIPQAGSEDNPRSQAEPSLRSTVSGTMDRSIRWPVQAKEVMYMTGKLYGVVLLGERSESVKSLTQGTVVSAGPYRGFGKVAIVQMTGGYLYVYGGCESLSVKEGDRVAPGTELGKLGIDGVSSKPQLFFLVYRSNTPVDPAKAPRT